MNIQRGFRDKLDKYANPAETLEIEMNIDGGAVYDFSCFGVNSEDKLSDERYMVFYNQTSSPNNEIVYTAKTNGALFKLELSRLPASVCKLVFTASIDGKGNMGEIRSHSFTVRQKGKPVIELSLSGSDFKYEKAVISAEIYKKDVWRLRAVASGFNGGLGDLLKSYGGEEAEPASAPVRTQQPRVQPTPPSVRQPQPVPPPAPRQPQPQPAPPPAPRQPQPQPVPPPAPRQPQTQSSPIPVRQQPQIQPAPKCGGHSNTDFSSLPRQIPIDWTKPIQPGARH